MSTYREQDREDRKLAAQLKTDAKIADSQARIAERRAVGEQRRLDQAAAAEQARRDRQIKRDNRADRWAALRSWAAAHYLDLMFVPIIVVPGILSWVAMAVYGSEVFGPTGWLLPMFSEAAAWAFAAANTLTRRRRPGAPTWHLVTGVWVFSAVQALLNFIHGFAGDKGRLDYGAVMAAVAISGVLAHQLITAGPRMTKAERADAQIREAAAKRELAVRKAATRTAVAELDETGQARLVYRPGTVTLRRRIARRSVLVEAVVPARPIPVPDLGETLADAAARYLDSDEATGIRNTLGTAQTSGSEDVDGAGDDERGTGFRDLLKRIGPGARDERFEQFLDQVRRAVDAGDLPAQPSRKQVRDLLGCRTQVAGAVRRAFLDDDGDDVPVAA